MGLVIILIYLNPVERALVMRDLWNNEAPLTAERITKLLLHGTVAATLLTSIPLIVHDTILSSYPTERIIATIGSGIVLLIAEILLYKKQFRLVNWCIIILHLTLAMTTLFFWGINSPFGILMASFAILLASVLLGPRFIAPVLLLTLSMFWGIHSIHSLKRIVTAFSHKPYPSTYWDVLVYSILFATLAFISWLIVTLQVRTLARARQAENKLRASRKILAEKLEQESSTLREEQIRQIHQLHKFAVLGQSTAATLHELSNHLSVLNLDINDIHQHHKNSRAIANAKESIHHINAMVTQARRRLSSYHTSEKFDALSVVNQSIKDLQQHFTHRKVRLIRSRAVGGSSFPLIGNPLALTQIITVLTRNALDACSSHPHKNPTVTLQTKINHRTCTIIITDTGPGVPLTLREKLFQPVTSTKPTGLGVGLFIAKHLVESQLGGAITHEATAGGTKFIVTLPRQTTSGLKIEPQPSHNSPSLHGLHSVASS